MKLAKFILVVTIFTGCTMNVRLVQENPDQIPEEILQVFKDQAGEPVFMDIGSTTFGCKILNSDAENVTVQNNKAISRIPIRAITSLTIPKGEFKTKGMIVGGLLGGVTGSILGSALSKETNNYQHGDEQTKYRIAAGIAGAGAGALIGSLFQEPEEHFEVNPKAKIVALTKKMNKSITSFEVERYGIFKNIRLDAGEQLLKVEVLQYGNDDYLLCYETHDGKTSSFRFETEDGRYIETQKNLIREAIENPSGMPFQNQNNQNGNNK